MVLIDSSSREREDVLAAMVTRLSNNGLVANREKLLREILEREKSAVVALGHGAALPHARCPGLKEPLVLAAFSRSGLAYWGPDREKVHLVIMVLSPQERPVQHLKILAGAASMLRKLDQHRDRLLQVSREEDLMQIMRELEALDA